MNTSENNRPSLTFKGGLVATQVNGNMVHLWFSSPTGDSSDCHIFQMKCQSHSQAVAIANNHNAIWQVPFTHEIQNFDESQLNDYVEPTLIG